MFPIYKKFEKLLAVKKITANKVSEDTGISTAIFSYWKSGRSMPKIDKIKIIADYFDVPIEYFLEE